MSEFTSEMEDFLSKTQEIMKNIGIPSCPKILLQLNEEMRKPEVDLAPIAQIIGKDVGLSARVLKIANSSLFASRLVIETIDQALTRMGMRNFRNAVMSGCLRQSLGDQAGVLDKFWSHSENVAMLAHRISQQCAPLLLESAYLVGLFHDCGLPLMLKKFPGYSGQMASALGYDPGCTAYEESRYGTSHSAAGALLSRTWGLPPLICEVVREHHWSNKQRTLPTLTMSLLAILQLAERIELQVVASGTELFHPEEESMKEVIASHLKLSPRAMESMAEELLEWLAPDQE